MKLARLASLVALAALVALPVHAQPRNILIFVADGLRYDSVTAESAPTMFRIKKQGCLLYTSPSPRD